MKLTVSSNNSSARACLSLAVFTLWCTLPLAAQEPQQTFPTADAAAQALFKAVQSGDEGSIRKILGGPSDLASSHEDGRDKTERDMFVQKYQEMHRIGGGTAAASTLYLGAENWPFPVPLVNPNGRWRFDSEEGMKEVIFRRIGDNEIAAIDACQEFVSAARKYTADIPDENEVEGSPEALVRRAARGRAGSMRLPWLGYYFRVIAAAPSSPGKFVLIAYPAEYRSSGVNTFIVTDKGTVYEKDLGPDTAKRAGAMSAFRKDGTWRTAD